MLFMGGQLPFELAMAGQSSRRGVVVSLGGRLRDGGAGGGGVRLRRGKTSSPGSAENFAEPFPYP